tara:strand:+ start:5128 stop:5481 length:354 start_codon:yes stop_codon:yes gene_type:complete
MSRPPHEPTDKDRATARALCAYGIPREEIAEVLGISANTLRKYYSESMRGSATEANAKVTENLFKMATGSGRQAVTAAIFWMKTRGGWREGDRTEITGADGGALTIRWSDERDRTPV